MLIGFVIYRNILHDYNLYNGMFFVLLLSVRILYFWQLQDGTKAVNLCLELTIERSLSCHSMHEGNIYLKYRPSLMTAKNKVLMALTQVKGQRYGASLARSCYSVLRSLRKLI